MHDDVVALLVDRHIPCPSCGYDLHAQPHALCPECGIALNRRMLERAARRRKGDVMVAGTTASTMLASPALVCGVVPTGLPLAAHIGLLVYFAASVAFSFTVVHAWDHPFTPLGRRFQNRALIIASWIPAGVSALAWGVLFLFAL